MEAKGDAEAFVDGKSRDFAQLVIDVGADGADPVRTECRVGWLRMVDGVESVEAVHLYRDSAIAEE